MPKCWFNLGLACFYNGNYLEAFDIYNDGLSNNKLCLIMEEILKYINDERDSFPLLSEFY